MPVQPQILSLDPGLTAERLLYVDVVKIVAVFGVLLLHSCDVFVDGSDKDPAHWWIGQVYSALVMGSAPLFAMCSGVLLLRPGKTLPVKAFYAKRLPKLLVPLFLWSVIYYIAKRDPKDLTSASIPDFFTALASGGISRHLWFLYMMVGVYLSIPFLQRMFLNAEDELYVYFIVLCFVLGSPQFIFMQLFHISLAFTDYVFTTFLGYFALGCYLGRRAQPGIKARVKAMAAFALALGATLAGVMVLKAADKGYIMFVLGYSMANVAAMAGAAFVFFRSLGYERLRPYAARIAAISNAAYGVYLVHILVQMVLRQGLLGFRFDALTVHPWLGPPVSALVLFALSLALTLGLKRFAFGRVLVP